MSSTLDDLEPYEIFQNELDEYLKEYKERSSNNPKLQNLLIINSFIEYICFIKSKSTLHEVTANEIKVDFMNYLVHQFEKEINSKEAIHSIYLYLKFIHEKNGQVPESLLNSLK